MKFEAVPLDFRVPRIGNVPAHDEHVENAILTLAQSELADLITLAVRVKRGTKSRRELGDALKPFGIRRKV